MHREGDHLVALFTQQPHEIQEAPFGAAAQVVKAVAHQNTHGIEDSTLTQQPAISGRWQFGRATVYVKQQDAAD
jgi:hypothetical protein